MYGTSTYGSSPYGGSLGATLAPPAPTFRSLERKLREAAILDPTLTAFLGTDPFRWYDMQEVQGSAYPLVRVLLVSAVPTYVTNRRLFTTLSRVQFTVVDTDSEEARAIESAIITFLDSFNAYSSGIQTTQQPNMVVNRRQGGQPQVNSLLYWRTIDAMIFNSENI